MVFTPYPDQVADLETMRKHNYTGLFNIQTGGAKTLRTCMSIKDSGASTSLIVAPAQTMATAWAPTIGEFVGVEAREIGNSSKAKRSALIDFELGIPGVYMVTPQLLARTDTSLWRGEFLALDESHTVMTPGSKSQRVLSGMTPTEHENSVSRRFEAIVAASGTLLRNRFTMAWSYGRTLWPELDARDLPSYSNYYVWAKDRMTTRTVYTAQKDRYGNTKTATEYLAEAEPGRWINEVPNVITHLKREQCCSFHPPVQRKDGSWTNGGFLSADEPTVIHETVPLVPEQKKAIREMETHLMTYLNDNPLIAELPMTKAQRIRQMVLGVPTVTYRGEDMEVGFDTDCKSPFFDRVVDLLNNEIEEETCLIFVESQKFAEVVTTRLNAMGVKAFEYSGKTKNVRDANVEQFGSKYRVMVAVLAAANSGIDSLQKVCANEIWLESSLDETVNEQARGRLDRIGQTRQVMRWMLHDDLGLSEGRYGDAIEKRLQLAKSLRKVA